MKANKLSRSANKQQHKTNVLLFASLACVLSFACSPVVAQGQNSAQQSLAEQLSNNAKLIVLNNMMADTSTVESTLGVHINGIDNQNSVKSLSGSMLNNDAASSYIVSPLGNSIILAVNPNSVCITPGVLRKVFVGISGRIVDMPDGLNNSGGQDKQTGFTAYYTIPPSDNKGFPGSGLVSFSSVSGRCATEIQISQNSKNTTRNSTQVMAPQKATSPFDVRALGVEAVQNNINLMRQGRIPVVPGLYSSGNSNSNPQPNGSQQFVSPPSAQITQTSNNPIPQAGQQYTPPSQTQIRDKAENATEQTAQPPASEPWWKAWNK